jgi:hypothetical protein
VFKLSPAPLPPPKPAIARILDFIDDNGNMCFLDDVLGTCPGLSMIRPAGYMTRTSWDARPHSVRASDQARIAPIHLRSLRYSRCLSSGTLSCVLRRRQQHLLRCVGAERGSVREGWRDEVFLDQDPTRGIFA